MRHADDLGIRVEAVAPGHVAENGHLLVMLVFFRGEEPAKLRGNATSPLLSQRLTISWMYRCNYV